MIKDKSHIKEAVLYGGLKYDADTTALVVENKKYTDIPRDLNIQHTFYPDSLNLRDGAKYLPATKWKIQCKLPPKTKRFCTLVLK